MSVSRMEKIARECLKPYWDVLGDPVYNWRPDFLKNPKTGRNLEIDIYFPKKKIAFEINGKQHQIRYQKLKDDLKKERCIENDIVLYQVTNLNRMFDILMKKLKLGKRRVIYQNRMLDVKAYKPKKSYKSLKQLDYKLRMEGIYERQDKEVLSNLERLFRRDQITELEYAQKKEEIERKYRLV